MNTRPTTAGDDVTFDAFTESRWVPLWISTLVTAQCVAFIALIVLFSPSHPLLTTLVLAFLVALEGIFTTRFLSTRRLGETDRTLYRLAELITILVATRITLWLATDTMPSWLELGRQLGNFTDVVFDLSFVTSSVVIVFVWLRAITFAAFVRDLSVTAEEANLIAAYRADKNNFPGGAPLEKNRTALAQQLHNSWAWGGVLLIISTVLTTFDFGGLDDGSVQFTQETAAPMLWLAITIYIVLGLWLVSWSRHLAQSARWMLLGVKPNPGVQQFCSSNALKLLLVVALGALFLPAGSAAPIVQFLSIVFSVVITLANWILINAAKLISWFTDLFGPPSPDVFEPLNPSTPFSDLPQPDTPLAQASHVNLPDFSALGWLALAAIVAVSFAYFFADRWRQWPNSLWRVLAKLWSILSRRRVQSPTILNDADKRTQPLQSSYQPTAKPSRRWTLGGLSSREQMFAIYLRFLQQCAKRGLPRSDAQTPSEYAGRLTHLLSDCEQPISDFTGAFHKARYAPTVIEPQDIRQMKRLYRALRRALRISKRV